MPAPYIRAACFAQLGKRGESAGLVIGDYLDQDFTVRVVNRADPRQTWEGVTKPRIDGTSAWVMTVKYTGSEHIRPPFVDTVDITITNRVPEDSNSFPVMTSVVDETFK